MAVRFIAPTGYQGGMRPGVEYTMIRDEGQYGRVLLVGFPLAESDGRKRRKDRKKAAKKPRTRKSGSPPKQTRRVPHLVILPYGIFLEGLRPAKSREEAPLKPVASPTMLPPWLSDYEGKDLDAIPALRELRSVKPLTQEEKAAGKQERTPTSPRSETEARLANISVALERVREILSAADPDGELNRLARQTVPASNETRFRLLFYVYIAYDYKFWALMPSRQNYGRWDRTDRVYAESILGADRVHHGGTPRCWTSEEMRQKMADTFKTRAELGMTMAQVWSAAIRLDFGGRIERVEVLTREGAKRKRWAAFHNDGKPLPSPDVYRYHVIKILGAKFVKEKLRGKLTVEMKEPQVGSYYEELQYLGQQANFDARHLKERFRTYLKYQGKYDHLPPLIMVDLVDGATGHIDGVGPSLGGEDAEGYNLAKFCAAIDKQLFAKIVGIKIPPAMWTSKGLHRTYFSDRGKGASDEVRRSVVPWGIGSELARSFTPKDDSIVEGKHPKGKRILGAPTTILSELTLLEGFEREIFRALQKNHSDNALPRASDRAVVEEEVSAPEQMYAHLKEQFRDNLIQISFAEAARQFLRPIKFNVLADGKLRYRGKTYASQQMHDCGLARYALKHGGEGFKIPGYLYWPATRYMWAEFEGQVIWLEKQSSDDALVTNCSDQELEMIELARSRASGLRQQQKPLVEAFMQQAFHEETGKEWNAGRRVSGRVKVSKQAREEAEMMKAKR